MDSTPVGSLEPLTAIGLDLGPSAEPSAELSPAPTAQSSFPPTSEQSPAPTLSPDTADTPAAARKRGCPSAGSSAAKRPRSSQASATIPLLEKSLDFLEIPLPHYEIIAKSGTLEDPHIFRVKTGVSDGSEAAWPALGVPNRNNDAPFEPQEKHIRTWLFGIGNSIAEIEKWRKRSTVLLE